MKKFVLSIIIALFAFEVAAAEVKLSTSGICHDENSRWYQRTKNYTAFSDMETCLLSGRAYSGYVPNRTEPQITKKDTHLYSDKVPIYDRALYGSWADLDADCQNTRHELLAELSTAKVIWNESGCSVIRGRWIDPYTNKIFTNASDIDIDHLVPLSYAHDRGAAYWSTEEKTKFANDQRNLFAVDASANRSKGAHGPLSWLPPNEKFRCQYISRFMRIMMIYGLNFHPEESVYMEDLRDAYC